LLDVAHINQANSPPVGKNTNAALKLREKGLNPNSIPASAMIDSKSIKVNEVFIENRSSSAVTPVARTGSSEG
jgi:hypothetical protein